MKHLKILTCECGAKNELSSVEYDEDFYPSFAVIECMKSGKVREFGSFRGQIFAKMINRATV